MKSPSNQERILIPLIEKIHERIKSIPLFLKKANGKIIILTAIIDDIEIEKGDKLVYVGQEIEAKAIRVEEN